MKKVLAVFLLGASLWMTQIAQAAQDATIVIDNAIIRSEPKDKSKVLEYVPIGMEVRISSYPVEGGWYKIRAKNSQYGWIHESYLSVQPSPKDEAGAVVNEADNEDPTPKPDRDRKFFARVFYGMQSGSATDINAVFNFDDFKTLNFFGGEAGYFFNPKFAALLRSESIYKSVVAKESVTGITYNVGVSSFPIMIGAEYYLVKIPPMRLSFGALAGIAFNTAYDVTALNMGTPNTLTLAGSPITWMVKLNLTRPLGRLFSVFLDAGYRQLATSVQPTSGAATMNGGQVFMKNGSYVSRVVDLSGIFGSVGLGIHL